MKILDFNQTYSTDNYPYGSLKAKMSFAVEFKALKGCRTVRQSVNPKNGRLNAPKNSTYSPLICLAQADNEHYEFIHFDVNSREERIKTFKFFADEENFNAANVSHEAFKHILALAFGNLSVSFSFLSFETPEEKNAYMKRWYEPVLNKIPSLLRGCITAADFKELLDLVISMPMSLSEKKNYIIDNNMCIGKDEWVIRTQMNASTEAELDEIISNWEKALALGVS